MQADTFLLDVPASLAQAAYSGISFTPERRAESARNDYASTLAGDYADLQALAQREGTLALLADEFERYRAGYRARYTAYLGSSSRCVSWMIAGPGNFPSARMNKRADMAHKRLNELCDFRTRALAAIKRTLCPGAALIMAGDTDAVERLQARIAEADRQQAHMRAVNEAHKRFLRDPASLDRSDLPEAWKAQVRSYKPAYSWEPHPFAPFQLTNNSASIRRMRERLVGLQVAPAAESEVPA